MNIVIPIVCGFGRSSAKTPNTFWICEMNEPSYTKKESYIVKLHELLWAFIARTHPNMTGDVVECAEEVLKNDEEV